MKTKVDMGRSDLRTKIVWAICALLIGVVGTTVFFLTRNGKPVVENAATEEVATSVEESKEAETPEAAANPVETRAILASWDTESETYKKLTTFVENACDPSSDGYIPPEDRITTFDMDGTFICEKASIYIDMMFAVWRVLEDPNFDAPADLRTQVESVLDEVEAGVIPKKVDLNTGLAEAYDGKTPEELMSDVVRFAESKDALGFSGMTYSQTFYRPMLEVIEYLRANDFDVWVVTACERYVSRALAVEYVGFDPTHVVGTDLVVEATGQDTEDGLDYTFEQNDELVIAGPHESETGKTNKVIAIENEIGRRPVLSFGNSSGDFAMLNYATANPAYPGLGFLVVADDTEREYGDEEKAASMRQEIADQGWVGISMRDDWTTIYGNGVEKTGLPAQEELAEAA